jgi:hypothetical protein
MLWHDCLPASFRDHPPSLDAEVEIDRDWLDPDFFQR